MSIGASLLLLLTAEPAGAASLRGVIKADGEGGSPVAKVEVSGIPPGNKKASNDDGTFLLEFDRKPGDSVEIVIKKEGYEVINYFELTRQLPSDPDSHPVTIYICERERREEMARRFFRLASFEAIEARYQRQLQELKSRGEATAAELAKALNDRDLAKKQAEQYAQDLARVKPEDSSAMYREAMQFLTQGKADEALHVLDDAKLKQAVDAAQQKVQQGVENYLLKARILTTQFKFEEAERTYQAAVAAAPENFNAAFSFAYFSQSLNHNAQALTAYQRALALARLGGDQGKVANALNDLGLLYLNQNRMDYARAAFDEALEIYRQFAKTNPDTYLPYVAMTLNNIRILNDTQNRIGYACAAFEDALRIRRNIAKTNPETHLPYIANVLNNLGILRSAQNRKEDAYAAYGEAIKIRRDLAKINPDTYIPDIAETLNNLGLLHFAQNRMEEARAAYVEALAIYRNLAKSNPEAYLPYVARTLNNLGNLHCAQKRMEDARAAYSEALAIFRQFAKTNPDTYLPYVVTTLIDLGNLFSEQNRIEEALAAYASAFTINQNLAEKRQEKYQNDSDRAIEYNRSGNIILGK